MLTLVLTRTRDRLKAIWELTDSECLLVCHWGKEAQELSNFSSSNEKVEESRSMSVSVEGTQTPSPPNFFIRLPTGKILVARLG